MTTVDLAAIREAWGDRDVKVVAFTPDSLPWGKDGAPEPLRTTTITSWRERLNRLPFKADENPSTLWVATIEPDGSLTPVDAG